MLTQKDCFEVHIQCLKCSQLIVFLLDTLTYCTLSISNFGRFHWKLGQWSQRSTTPLNVFHIGHGHYFLLYMSYGSNFCVMFHLLLVKLYFVFDATFVIYEYLVSLLFILKMLQQLFPELSFILSLLLVLLVQVFILFASYLQQSCTVLVSVLRHPDFALYVYCILVQPL